MVRGKAEEAGGLTPAKDDGEVLRHLGPRTFVGYFDYCYSGEKSWYAERIPVSENGCGPLRLEAPIRKYGPSLLKSSLSLRD